MTKKEMLAAAKHEYFTCMDMWQWYYEEGKTEQAERWHSDAMQTEHLIHIMFGDSVNVFHEWLDR